MENYNCESKSFDWLANLIKNGDVGPLKQQLLQSKMDVESKDAAGNTALLLAARLGQFDCVDILLEFGGANCQVINVYGQNALTLATYAGCIKCIKKLLTKWTYKSYTESSLLPPVCVAAMKGHANVIKFFCQLTPMPNSIQSVHGVTALDLAKMNGHREIVQLLVKDFRSRPVEFNGKQKRKMLTNRATPY